MAGLLGLSRLIDAINRFIGKQVSWLILFAVLVSAYNAIVRFLGDGLPAYLPIPRASNSLLELQWYLYGTVFLLASAYTLQRNEHIRIDIVSSLFSKRTRDWIDLFCHIFFLLPFVTLIVWLSWPWFQRSFVSGEISANASGLIIWPAKFMVLAGFVLLTAQAVSEIIKRWAVLSGMIDEPNPQHELHPAAEAAIEMEEKRDD
ncbi:TRAP transporter small permease subunit [Nitratireductor aquimarinus]|uniref:TRAP transporter small permease subunit n=1 Tax=Nitratireductor TaxID=245876 RepID=UPI000DDF2B00|nr:MULTISPECIES: TRAP transporter small permease subunit [Nitratireductor]MBN7775292.1 TRAP transporter small permease subunit [Nitratireductor pacificus]MBN7781306.1 TRAP transporter small permease subunit [Nitratireductor pacificus]MBN7790112.1 TRAP transporter small permease subunit [Nitratireductor aquimarinus]MBN8243926.1 TRAP transporter small permease subunit [Nitratireductor aquimarinus]MBY6097679.1 TRAP transporter small permease subunit [Nitratireductor aquimarinus]